MYKVGDVVLIKQNCIYEDLRGQKGVVKIINREGGDFPLIVFVRDATGYEYKYRYALDEVMPLHLSFKVCDFEF